MLIRFALLTVLAAASSTPRALDVPAGNQPAFRMRASGVQIYDCNGSAWVFRAPEAGLFNAGGQIKGTHFAGPTWESNGGRVVAVREAGATVDPTAIPWLLLRAVSWEGRGRMTGVTYIQRVETAGGLAPASGCDAAHAGAVARVGYTATYVFFTDED